MAFGWWCLTYFAAGSLSMWYYGSHSPVRVVQSQIILSLIGKLRFPRYKDSIDSRCFNGGAYHPSSAPTHARSVYHSLSPFTTLIRLIIVGIKLFTLQVRLREPICRCKYRYGRIATYLNYICCVTRYLRTGVASSLIFMQVGILRHKRYILGMRGVAQNVYLKTCLFHPPFIWSRVCIVQQIFIDCLVWILLDI
jgi:hypothetical protein